MVSPEWEIQLESPEFEEVTWNGKEICIAEIVTTKENLSIINARIIQQKVMQTSKKKKYKKDQIKE